MAKFFIDRPIFAWVIAIVIMLAGALSILKLPVSQYPPIAPPSVQITAVYPGASAQTVQDTVTQVIEQQMNGIDHLEYMSSTSDGSGTAQITLTFAQGTDPDIAQVQVQNKLQLATPLLPQQVQQQGIKVAKAAKNFLLVIGAYSDDGAMSDIDLANYIAANMQDPISRVNGVGQVQLFGSQYAMRIWVDPQKLNSYNLTVIDVSNAIQAQNVQISAGELGGAPAVKGQQLNATVMAQSRLQTPEQFRKILLKVNKDGSQVRLGDVARVELGGESYQIVARYNGKPAAGLAITLATGANALQTATAVKQQVSELEPYFPAGMKVDYPYDTTPFVKISIEEVIKTLIEGIVLVFLVMYLFLQNLRATIIPTIAVPVVLLGTFGIMGAAGFSINTLSMFGLVLAIGLLVDDAIVVVENVERVMAEEGLSPKEATKKAMGQIVGALVGVALVLSAVFVPMAFFGGSTGAIYRQFSLTIVAAMALSVLVAIVLTPAMCATILKPIKKGEVHEKRGFFGWFNRTFDNGSKKYQSQVERILKRGTPLVIVYVVIVAAVGFLFVRMPTAFLPDEDQGYFFNIVQLPPGATQERTLGVMKQVEKHYLEKEKDAVRSIFTVTGFGFNGRGQNVGIAFTMMKPWDQRQSSDLKVQSVIARSYQAFASVKDAMIFAVNPPSVPELGNAGGIDFELQDRAGLGHDALIAARNQFLGMAAKNPNLANMRPNGLEDTPQYKVDVDEEKASALGLSIADVYGTLSASWGSSYVNDFIDHGRVKKVYVMAEPKDRMLPQDINKLYVRNSSGKMVPFSAFATGKWIYGSPRLERYNGVPAVEIQGVPAPGKSSGDAMRAVEEIAKQLPPGIGLEWTGLSFEERISGAQAPALYAISILIVFLCLAALYESWSIPFSVILVVPLGVLGALLAATLRGLSNDVYFQVGLLTTVGLSAKNAILIVEFAKDLQEQGRTLMEATMEAVRLRLRPILMTSMAFILGVLPLAISNGAGSASQHAIGTGVIGGMLAATFLAIYYVPLFFVMVRKRFAHEDLDTVEHPEARHDPDATDGPAKEGN
ncbi:efflux RND transporter permease subunit [Pandoraea pulmonicola]|uniref:Efflux pump membrane transporter n=1 Tax=Pandoraea pulmonicola TaxID=93221 RepID=A0AAJ5D2B4_PANPU|nr:efflux RND transporter permease subunit [Pandoraea pulmonicola]AJC19521.1 multidrug efflux RND transporter permease [Pandoraea pulmonicola]SUA92420.1 Multidrug-efflux transporter MexB [Pandoraea pulmonicola]